MASRGLGSLTLSLVLGLGGFTAPLDKAGRDLDKKTRAMQKRAYEFGKNIGVAMKAAAIGLVAVGTAAAAAIKGAIDRADEMSKAAQKVGLSTEAFSRLEYAATLADVSLEQLSGAIVKMTKFQAESVDKASEAAIVFTKLGVDAIDPLTGKMRKGEEVFRDFVGVLSKLDGPEKLAIGLKVFGKSFADLIPLIDGGVEGLDRLGKESDRIGNTITTGAGLAAEEFNDQLETIERTLKGVALTAAADLLPQLKDMADDLQKIADNGQLVEKLSSIFGVIGTAARLVGKTVQIVVDTVQALTSVTIGLGLAAQGVLQGLSRNMEGAKKSFTDARREMTAAAEAFDSAKATPGKIEDNRPGGNIVFIDPPAFDASAVAAQKAAKEILDADNQIRDSAAKTAAAKRAQSKADSEAKKADAEAAREQEQRERDLADAVEKAAQATADFKTSLEDLQAAGDPLDESALSYKRELEDIQKLAREGEVSTSDLAKAEELLAEAYAKTTAEIKERLDTGGQQLKQMQQELDLLNMQTDAERVRAQFLMDHPTATTEQADAAVRMQQQIDETREAISAMDDFRSSFEDFVVAAANGKASFKDFADMVIQQIIRMGAAQLTASLFGQQGTTGGGWIGGLLSAFFGGGASTSAGTSAGAGIAGAIPGFATGTDFAPGGFALVGEHGPEIVNLPRGSQVTPNNRVGMGNTINITVQGNATRETAQQMANEVGRKLIFAGRGT
jgi:hypothetical protein